MAVPPGHRTAFLAPKAADPRGGTRSYDYAPMRQVLDALPSGMQETTCMTRVICAASRICAPNRQEVVLRRHDSDSGRRTSCLADDKPTAVRARSRKKRNGRQDGHGFGENGRQNIGVRHGDGLNDIRL